MKTKSKMNILNFLIQYSGYILLLLTIVMFSLLSPFFLNPTNLLNIILQSSSVGIIGLGMTAILIGGGSDVIRGGIDLSLANNMAISSNVMAVLFAGGASLQLTLSAGLATSIVVGTLIALSIVKLRLIPLLATLSMMYILQGAIRIVSNNRVVNIQSPFFRAVSNETLAGVPIIVLIFLVVAAILYILFNRSTYGNRVLAVGGNRLAAQAAGINVNLLVVTTYLIAASTAFLSAVITTSRLSGSTPGMGETIFLDVILIGYMSAIFSKLAVPNIPGAVLSAVFVGMMANGFTLLHVPTFWVHAIRGALILFAVGFTTVRKGKVT